MLTPYDRWKLPPEEEEVCEYCEQFKQEREEAIERAEELEQKIKQWGDTLNGIIVDMGSEVDA